MRRAAVLLALAACGGPLDHKKLRGEVQDLHSIAAEARMLFERGAPRAFFDVHREMLADNVKKAGDKLLKGVDDDALEPSRQEAEVLARALEPIVRTAEDPEMIKPFEMMLFELDQRLKE